MRQFKSGPIFMASDGSAHDVKGMKYLRTHDLGYPPSMEPKTSLLLLY
jgi:hypothetical protein